MPRGTNYIRLNGSQGFHHQHQHHHHRKRNPSHIPPPPNLAGTTPPLPVYHSTFSPKLFNQSEAAAALKAMQAGGFNIVRVFLDPGDFQRDDSVAGDPSGAAPLGATYVANLATFISLAGSAGIYTYVTVDSIPTNQYFSNLTRHASPNLRGVNGQMMDAVQVQAKAAFLNLLLSSLQSHLGTLSSIITVSLGNEICYDSQLPPFSLSGPVATMAGTFNMSDPSSRQSAADTNMNLWAHTLAETVHAQVPGQLVNIGMFSYQAVGKPGPNGLEPVPKGDTRYPARPALLSRQQHALDFLDFHVYPLPVSWGG